MQGNLLKGQMISKKVRQICGTECREYVTLKEVIDGTRTYWSPFVISARGNASLLRCASSSAEVAHKSGRYCGSAIGFTRSRGQASPAQVSFCQKSHLSETSLALACFLGFNLEAYGRSRLEIDPWLQITFSA